MGASFFLVPSMAIVQLYFEKRRVLAAGIATMGFSAATLLVPVITQVLLENYTLQQVLFLMSIFPLQVILIIIIVRRKQSMHIKPHIDSQILCSYTLTEFRTD